MRGAVRDINLPFIEIVHYWYTAGLCGNDYNQLQGPARESLIIFLFFACNLPSALSDDKVTQKNKKIFHQVLWRAFFASTTLIFKPAGPPFLMGA